MQKRRKLNLVWIFYDGQKFWRQCVKVIDAAWSHIYFLTCKNFEWEFQTDCAKTFNANRLKGQAIWDDKLCSPSVFKPTEKSQRRLMTFHTGSAQVRLLSVVYPFAFPPTWIIKCVWICALVWWKSMKQLLPSKLDGEDCVRYSSTARVDHQRPRVEPAGTHTNKLCKLV